MIGIRIVRGVVIRAGAGVALRVVRVLGVALARRGRLAVDDRDLFPIGLSGDLALDMHLERVSGDPLGVDVEDELFVGAEDRVAEPDLDRRFVGVVASPGQRNSRPGLAVLYRGDGGSDFLPVAVGPGALEHELQREAVQLGGGLCQQPGGALLQLSVLERCFEDFSLRDLGRLFLLGQDLEDGLGLPALDLPVPAHVPFPVAVVRVLALDDPADPAAFVAFGLAAHANAFAGLGLEALPLHLRDVALGVILWELVLDLGLLAVGLGLEGRDLGPAAGVIAALDDELVRLVAQAFAFENEGRLVAGLVLLLVPMPVDEPVLGQNEQIFGPRLERARDHRSGGRRGFEFDLLPSHRGHLCLERAQAGGHATGNQ